MVHRWFLSGRIGRRPGRAIRHLPRSSAISETYLRSPDHDAWLAAPYAVSAAGWEPLTTSEWRIARLVGEGLTNPQIAEELVLSRRTVETHLSRIYPKIGVGNRTELALSLRERDAEG